MLRFSRKSPRRIGTATVEMAVIIIPLYTLLVGVWEVGRLVEVTQIVSNAAREAAREAAQGQIIYFNQNAGGFQYSPIWTYPQSDPTVPNLTTTVRNYLTGSSIDLTGVTDAYLVQFVNNSQVPPVADPVPPPTPALDKTQPWGAAKNDRLSITVTVPFSNVRWSPPLLINPAQVTATVDCFSVVDSWFVLDTNIAGGADSVASWAGYTVPAP